MKNRGAENLISFLLCFVVMFIFALITLFLNVQFAIAQFASLILLVIICLITIRKNYGKISGYIEDITFHVDNATKDSLIYAPMPVVIFKRDGNILWYNKKFEEAISGIEAFGMSVEEVFQTQVTKNVFETENNVLFSCYLNENHYTVYGNSVKADKKENNTTLGILYLFDDTENYQFKKRYKNERVIVAIINLDNYDDVLNNTPNAYRSLLLAEVENRIYTWFSFAECIIRKVERDRYLIIFRHKYLEEMINKKFSVLDDVREIKCGNKFSATLSIGIGFDEQMLSNCYEYASSAINLALGRGGDQVVIKDNENVSYYGGKSREHEKTTKVKARTTMLALKELVEHSSDVIVIGHQFPDIDAIGAAVGINVFARSFGKNAYIVYDTQSVAVTQMIASVNEEIDYSHTMITSQQAKELVKPDSLIVVVDTHRPAYTECPELLDDSRIVALIDHHRRGAEFIDNAKLVYHEPYASSTCEMVTELLQYVGDKLDINAREADMLYAGIMLDTKDFSMKTGVRTFEAAAFLKRCGVDIAMVKRFFKNDFNSFVTISKVVSEAEIISGSVAISVCMYDGRKELRTIVPQAADRLLSISGVEASFVIMQMEEETIISGRSTGNINVQVIMEQMGGGGHQTMAGCQIKNTSYEEVKKQLVEEINKYMDEQQE